MKIGHNKYFHKVNPQSNRTRAFISYSYKDKRFKSLLDIHKKAGSLDYIDYSIKSPYDMGWKRSAAYRERNSDVCIICPPKGDVGKGMKKEIKLAKKYNMPIISLKMGDRSLSKEMIKEYDMKEITYDCKGLQKELDKARKNRKK